MSYKRSLSLNDFELRHAFLLERAKRAAKLKSEFHDLRDIVFQCCIFQLSAAL
jgi:hypothetical protein